MGRGLSSGALSSLVGHTTSSECVGRRKDGREVTIEEEEIAWAIEGYRAKELTLGDIISTSGKPREYWKEVLGLQSAKLHLSTSELSARASDSRGRILVLLQKGYKPATIARMIKCRVNNVWIIQHEHIQQLKAQLRAAQS